MSPGRQLLIMLAVALIAAAGGYFLADALSGPDSPPAQIPSQQPASPDDLLGEARPEFKLVGLDGTPISSADFNGQVLLLNFWATWCKPCVEEMPMLSDIAQAHEGDGFTVLGIAVDDPEKAREFVQNMNLAYPVAVGAAQNAVLGRRYGNHSGMLPYSVLIDRQGKVSWAFLGALQREELIQEIRRLL